MGKDQGNHWTQIIVAIIGATAMVWAALITSRPHAPSGSSGRSEQGQMVNPPRADELDIGGSGKPSPPDEPGAGKVVPPKPPEGRAELVEPSEPEVDISGTWADQFGNVFLVNQHGAQVEMSARNAYNGLSSQAQGTIQGNQVDLSYWTTLPSVGKSRGTLSADGRQITSQVQDSMLGNYVLVIQRQ